jgi:hypothetical protein
MSVTHHMDVEVASIITINPKGAMVPTFKQWHFDRPAIDVETKTVGLARNQDSPPGLVNDRAIFALLHIVQIKAKVVAVQLELHFTIAVITNYGDGYFCLHFFPGERSGCQAQSSDYKCNIS